ncbi:hypothetical protein H8N03_14875 [Ramlibacter sp. USB13]|uniref:Uncharacterized protein n=1 Tax=Ramlibacter cellulosilyticus TaxID=2764187 RepID=A0A923MT11_9BURK|nr:hypothetical protein [Ramlibacter cellulosilyticus]MBC5784233.1 hypothetical protein [Ramlibacter cellulosilyticus]
MPAATRLLVAFVLLVCAFVVLVGVAVFSLYVAGEGMLAAVVATAGLAGVAAGGVTYWFLRGEVMDETVEFELEPLVPATPAPASVKRAQPVLRRTPLRVQAMPVADLPPAYVDAVMRGAQARLNALKAEERQHPSLQ